MPRKKPGAAAAKKRLWRIFSEYIKLRDTHPDGVGYCISSGRPIQYPNGSGNVHAGHYYARSKTYANLYFDERNVNAQSAHDNLFLQGNAQGYAKGLIKKYGPDILDELDIKKSLPMVKMYERDYEALILHYKAKVAELKEERGLQ